MWDTCHVCRKVPKYALREVGQPPLLWCGCENGSILNKEVAPLIFVFGSNRQGIHGGGAAKYACEHFAAKYGNPRGLQGYSYAIVTKELRHNVKPVTLAEIKIEAEHFVEFAAGNPALEFLLTPIGTGLAGFTVEEIAPLFKNSPPNVVLPQVFKNFLETAS